MDSSHADYGVYMRDTRTEKIEFLSRLSPEFLERISNLLERFENGDDACPSKFVRKQRLSS